MMAGGKKMSEKAKGKQKEKAKAAALPVGQALMSASLPLTSKKRKHQLTVADLSSSAGSSSAGDTGVSVRQIQRDTAAIKAFVFKQTADNPARLAAATGGNEAEHGRIAATARFTGQSRQKVSRYASDATGLSIGGLLRSSYSKRPCC